MPSTVDITHAEQGKTVRIPFTVLASGAPFDPIGTGNPTDVTIQDAPTSTPVTVLSGVSTGEIGKFYVDWDVALAQAPGFYEAVVVSDNGGGAGSFTTTITFEVFASGTFAPSILETAQDLQTTVSELSQKRDLETFCAMVRTILRDHPQLNRLTQGRETSDGEIKIAAQLAVSQYNGVPPLLAEVTFSNFPSLAYLTLGTIGWVLQSSFLLRLRNNLQYSDGGVSVDTENVAGYAQAAQNFYKAAYDQWIPDFKKSKNLNDAFGASPTGTHSEYFLLAALLGDSSYGGAGALLQ